MVIMRLIRRRRKTMRKMIKTRRRTAVLEMIMMTELQYEAVVDVCGTKICLSSDDEQTL